LMKKTDGYIYPQYFIPAEILGGFDCNILKHRRFLSLTTALHFFKNSF